MCIHRFRYTWFALAVIGWGAVFGAPTGASAAIVTLNSTVHGYVEDADPQDDVGDSFNANFVTVSSLPGGAEIRGIIEFGISSLTAPVLSAHLSLTETNSNYLDPVQYALIGYTGNGTLDLADYMPAGPSVITAFQHTGLTNENIDVTAFINAQIAADDLAHFAGFVIGFADSGVGSSDVVTFGQFDVANSFPELQVSAVPLPAALPLFLSALAGLGLFARRRRKVVGSCTSIHAKSRAGGVVRLALARLVAAVFAIVLLLPTNGQAAPIRTIDFEATSLSEVVGDPFGLLGIASAGTVTGSFTFDTAATPYLDMTFEEGTSFERVVTSWPYTSFSANVGAVTLNGAVSTSTNDSIEVQDGTGSSSIDQIRVTSLTDQSLSAGVTLDALQVFAKSLNSENPFDGTSVPSVAALNSMVDDRFFAFDLLDGSSQSHIAIYSSITFSEVSPVPLPAALPLFLTALVGLIFVGRRRRQTAA